MKSFLFPLFYNMKFNLHMLKTLKKKKKFAYWLHQEIHETIWSQREFFLKRIKCFYSIWCDLNWIQISMCWCSLGEQKYWIFTCDNSKGKYEKVLVWNCHQGENCHWGVQQLMKPKAILVEYFFEETWAFKSPFCDITSTSPTSSIYSVAWELLLYLDSKLTIRKGFQGECQHVYSNCLV